MLSAQYTSLLVLMIPNIYQSERYKLLIVVPLALLAIGLVFIPHIQLDTSLRGGVSLQMQTNTTLTPVQITSMINARIPGAQTQVVKSDSGLTITLAANSSITAARDQQAALYSAYSNYSNDTLRMAIYQNELKLNASNTTAQGLLTAARFNQSLYSHQISASFAAISADLTPFNLVPNSSLNLSSPAGMVAQSTTYLTQAASSYERFVLAQVGAVIPFTTYSYQEITPSQASSFLSSMIDIIIAAFVLVAISVFFIFRTPLPSFTVVFGAANDILIALGAMGAFGIPLGTASIGGLLMLIGYSIDTDILSSIRILKRGESTPQERAFSTMKTGVTMTSSAIISFAILFVISYIAFIPTYYEIAGVVLVGLIADLFTTWFGNTPIILWYKLRKGVH